jgi:dTDP-glucose 4,6-dehydratase
LVPSSAVGPAGDQLMATILVTGGAGFIGSNFLNRVVPAHPEHRFVNVDKLTYAANLASLTDVAALSNYALERVDLADREAVAGLFARTRPDHLIHFAAESHVDRSIVTPGAFIQTNIVGTFNLLEACRDAWTGGEHVFHHVSTDEVFGSLDGPGHFDELSRYAPSSPYSASKAASDHLVFAYHRTFGIPVKVTNCSNNYGPRQFPEKLVPLMILNAVAGLPLPVYGRGANVRDWLYVDDHCDAVWLVFEQGRVGETYVVGGGAEMANLDTVRAICKVVAEQTGKPAAELEGLIRFVADRPGHDLRYAVDSSKIQRELGWRRRESFETGLEKTVRWYLENTAWVDGVRTGAYRDWIAKNYEGR